MAICCFALNACHDDTFDIYVPKGDAAVDGFTFTVNLPELSEANLLSRGTEGDAIKEIGDNMRIYIYAADGGLLHSCGKEGFVNYSVSKDGNKAYAGFPYRQPDMNRYDADGNYPDALTPEENAYWEQFKPLSAEQKTPCATFTLKDFKPAIGEVYQICVTANVDVPESNYVTLSALKDFIVEWDEKKVKNNAQMFGMFSTDEKQVEGAPISVQPGTTTKLHAWLVRCASKVTVSFNTEQLNDNVWIYLHNVTIHNIPRTCHLRYGNVPMSDEDVIESGESIIYAPAGSNYDNAAQEFEKWPVLVRSTGTYGSDHSETAEAMFFYENLQGSGKDKSQQDIDDKNLQDGLVSYPESVDDGNYGWRDEKPYGTYIEVEAYYRSDVRGNEGKGKIVYRFQLGLDAFKDYNAFRNHHYKLTMNFRGNANDVDWHIDYQPESENHIYVPHPFYISYLYGEHVEMPVTIDGRLTPGTKVIAEIVENNWRPTDASPAIYWNGDVYSSNDLKYDGPWHGFLSLRPTNALSNKSGLQDIPNAEAIGRQYKLKDIDGFSRAYLMSYWYGGLENMSSIPEATAANCYTKAQLQANEGMYIPPQGYREYDTSNRDGVTYDDTEDNEDSYEIIEKQVGNGWRTHMYLPLYTRALFMVKTFGYSGANPYFGQQRKAVVKLTCWVDEIGKDGVTRSVKRTQLCNVVQVRRIMNPAGIYREAGNNQSFTVRLAHRLNEESNTFMPFSSDGKWSAEIESGDAGFITLNGQQKIYGSTGEFIGFQVHFIPTKATKNRYAVILVKYHDYTCKHRIMVRQGYEPDQLYDGSSKWHCFNLRGSHRECDSPLDPGSMFRFNNLTDGIDATSNRTDQVGISPSYLNIVGPDGNLKGNLTWDKISFNSPAQNKLGEDALSFRQNFVLYKGETQVNEGKKTHLPKYADWQGIRDNVDMNFSFGICYDGSSTSTAMTGDYAYNFLYTNTDNVGHGMRGIFAYNSVDARNMFLPIGSSGHGRRKDARWTESGGTMRYANRAVYMPVTAVTKLPMFWNIKDNTGGIYWGFPDNEERIDVWNGNKLTTFTAWDVNFTTYDFNHFSESAYAPGCSDAAFLRLVDE